MSTINQDKTCRVCECVIPKEENCLQSIYYPNRVICMTCFTDRLKRNVSDDNIAYVRKELKK